MNWARIAGMIFAYGLMPAAYVTLNVLAYGDEVRQPALVNLILAGATVGMGLAFAIMALRDWADYAD